VNVIQVIKGRLEWGEPPQSSASATNSMLLWDVPTVSLRATLSVENQPGIGTAFSPDGRWLLAALNFHFKHLP
jgi:hypothetical protein